MEVEGMVDLLGRMLVVTVIKQILTIEAMDGILVCVLTDDTMSSFPEEVGQ